MSGIFRFRLIREGRVLQDFLSKNGIVDTAADGILDAAFNSGASPGANWYVGLILGTQPGITIAKTDTMASNAWDEFAGYSEATRPLWQSDAPTDLAIGNYTNLANFTINQAGEIGGAFLTTGSAKGGTSGTLWSVTRIENVTLEVNVGDIIELEYSFGFGVRGALA